MVMQKDVAKAAGVTVATVSMALSGRGRVSPATRALISRLASEMSYTPRRTTGRAPDLRADVGLIVADDQSFIIPDFLRLVETYGLENRIEFVYSDNPGAELPHLLHEARGVLHIGLIGDRLRKFVEENPAHPFVALHDDCAYSVQSAFGDGVHHAVQYLLALGHRKIAFYQGCGRYAGPRAYNQAIRRCYEEYDLVRDERFAPYPFRGGNEEEYMSAALEWAHNLIHSGNPPTAFFCSGISSARAAIYAALVAGLRIPEDVSVVGVGPLGTAPRGIRMSAAYRRIFRRWSAAA